jgi:5-methylcytosine-specific restriction protein A
MASKTPKPWSRLYSTSRWERIPKLNLKMHKYLCQECLRNGKTEPATLSHHINEYRESFSELDFWYGELTALCKDCHARHHGYNVARDFETDIDASGWPCDPRHPVYQSNTAKREQSNE